MNIYWSNLLFIYVVLTQLYIGSLAMLCFRSLVRVNWLEPMVPTLLRLQKLIWFLVPLFLLVTAFSAQIYPWAAENISGNSFRAWYLSPSAFLLRGIFFWALWHCLSRAARQCAAWAGGPGLALLFFSSSFAAVDWILSIDKDFGSTIFGMVFFLSSLLLAFGFSQFFSAADSTAEQRRDQGNVHLSLVCTWAYLTFIQFLVIWSGNLPREVLWYKIRFAHGWYLIPILLGAVQFFLLFILLLQIPLKRSLGWSRWLAGISMLGQILFCYWEIVPRSLEVNTLTPANALAFTALASLAFFYSRRNHAKV